MRSRSVETFFVAVFFFALPLGTYKATSFYTDQYFRLKTIPYPSVPFAVLVGIGAACWAVGSSFLIYGFLFQKRRNSG